MRSCPAIVLGLAIQFCFAAFKDSWSRQGQPTKLHALGDAELLVLAAIVNRAFFRLGGRGLSRKLYWANSGIAGEQGSQGTTR